MIKVEFDSYKFKEILKYNFTNIHKLCDRHSPSYIGYSEKTLYRAVNQEVMSKDIYDAIMAQYDISECVIDFVYPEEEKNRENRRLREENTVLKQKIKELENELILLQESNYGDDYRY